MTQPSVETAALLAVDPSDPLWVRAVTRTTWIAAVVSGVLIVLMALNIVADFGGRTLFNHPLPGTLELVSYVWMPGLALLALGLAQLRGEQIRVELLADEATPRTRRVLSIVSEIVVFALLAWLSYLSLGKLITSLSTGESALVVQWIPLWPGRLMLLVALMISALAALARIYKVIHSTPTAIEGETHS